MSVRFVHWDHFYVGLQYPINAQALQKIGFSGTGQLLCHPQKHIVCMIDSNACPLFTLPRRYLKSFLRELRQHSGSL